MPRRTTKATVGGQIEPEALSTDDVIRQVLELFDVLGMSALEVASRVKGLQFLRSRPKQLYYREAEIGQFLTSWHQDSRYLDNKGMPLAINFLGGEPSFTALAKRILPRINPTKLLRELREVGAVSLNRRKQIKVEMRFLSVYLNRKFAIHYTLASLSSFVRTLKHNLLSEPSNANQLFHRVARNASIDLRDLATLKIRINRQGQQFLESCDNWMTYRSKSRLKSRGRRAQVSVGVYLAVDNVAPPSTRARTVRR